MNRTLASIVVVAVLAVGAGFLLGRTSATPSPAPSVLTVADTSVETSTPPKVVKQSNKARRSKDKRGAAPPRSQEATVGHVAAVMSTLPPADTPLVAIRADLEARARAGDAPAACRLGHELMRCQGMLERTQWLRDVDQQLARAPKDVVDRNVEFVARAENQIERARTVCEGITLEETLEGFDWLADAAERGNVAAMATFVRQPQLPFGRWIAELDRLTVYRDRAPGYAQRALESGEPRVLGVLAAAHAGPEVGSGRMPMGNPLQHLVEHDNVRAYAYAMLARELFPARAVAPMEFAEQRRVGPLIERLEATLSTEEHDAAIELFDTLKTTTFSAARPETAPLADVPTTFACEE